MNKADVLAIYEVELAGLGGDPDRLRQAWRGTRTRVSEAMQAETIAPARLPGEDPDVHHGRQKAHGIALWKDADALVISAGITETGRV